MGNSLQDQLLKSGLVTEDQVKKAKSQAHQKKKRTQRLSKAERAARARANEAAHASARAAKAAADTRLNEAREAKKEKRARLASVRDFLKTHSLNDEKGEIAHHFQLGGAVKRVYATEAQHKRLVEGTLLIACVKQRSFIIEASLAAKAQALDPDTVIVGPAEDGTTQPGEGDPYAGYEVPDDLIW